MASIFSKIIEGQIPSYKIAETEDFLAFLDVFPFEFLDLRQKLHILFSGHGDSL